MSLSALLLSFPPPPPPPTATSSDNQGPASPNLTARHFPYHSHSSESLDYLSGLMPKALSPTPYVPSGGHNTAGTASASMSGRVSPSVSPVTVSALSHYSSSSTTGLMEELQICSLDSPGCSPTPSPTLSYASVYTSNAGPDEALTPFVGSTASAATLTNVIIPPSQCCNTHPKQTNWFLLFFTSRNFGPILWTRPPFFTPSTNPPTVTYLSATKTKLTWLVFLHVSEWHLCHIFFLQLFFFCFFKGTAVA